MVQKSIQLLADKNRQRADKNKKYAGFSFLEVIVSLSIFVLIVVVTIFSFSSMVMTNKKASGINGSLENNKGVFEDMAKTIRMSDQLQVVGKTVYMYNFSRSQCVSYRFQNSEVEVSRFTGTPALPANQPDCSSSNANYGSSSYPYQTDSDATIDTTTSAFKLVNSVNAPISRVTILMKFNSWTLQTSVSTRNYDTLLYEN